MQRADATAPDREVVGKVLGARSKIVAAYLAAPSARDPRSFYLVYVNRSRASALKGLMAGVRRSIVEHKARGSLDRNLREIKARIEAIER